MEYFLDITQKEILTNVTRWMNLEDIILNEKSQSQRGKHTLCFNLREMSRMMKYSDRNQNSSNQRLEGETQGAVL